MPEIIFQKSFIISSIMCFDGCGKRIHHVIEKCIQNWIKQEILPEDAHLTIVPDATSLGIQKLTVLIESQQDDFIIKQNLYFMLANQIKKKRFTLVENVNQEIEKEYDKTHWINILINFISISMVITFAWIFPPSVLLTACLTSISLLSTAFTAREYLRSFWQNLRNKDIANMSTTVSLGWSLSLAHTLFHAFTMPLTSSLSMIFMSFIMPSILIMLINGMDEIKNFIMEKTKKIQLKGIKTSLFPELAENYCYYDLGAAEAALLVQNMNLMLKDKESSPMLSLAEQPNKLFIDNLLSASNKQEKSKNLLKVGMIIEVKPGDCFPVDCILVQDHAFVDDSVVTGEAQKNKHLWQSIPAGALNIGTKTAKVYVVKNPYHSTVNRILFSANAKRKESTDPKEIPKFTYLYSGLVIAGILGSVLIPLSLGFATTSLLLQNVIGVLFSVCPCTLLIAHLLPILLSRKHRSNKGIHLRDESFINAQTDDDNVDIIVFDKTGTLTSGNSMVASTDIDLNSPLMQKIYLLEKKYGREHPLAKAIQNYYESKRLEPNQFKDDLEPNQFKNDIEDVEYDEKNRGLKAKVQGKMIHIGSEDYLKSNNILLDKINDKPGFSTVYVAENSVYQGVIYIQHEPRTGVLQALQHLKKAGKKIIMLTGDNLTSAQGFNAQLNHIFADVDICAGQTPSDKADFLRKLLITNKGKKIWFVGDGLNDAACCSILNKAGGRSYAMNFGDKSAFFADICLNGSLDYLYLGQHHQLNQSLTRTIFQNNAILIYSTLVSLAFIISFSVLGIAVSPLISMINMVSTTFLVLFNSYRTQLIIDKVMDKVISWPKKMLSSDWSLGLLLGSSLTLVCSLLLTTCTTGVLTLPLLSFGLGFIPAISSVLTLSAVSSMSAFVLLGVGALLAEPITCCSVISNLPPKSEHDLFDAAGPQNEDTANYAPLFAAAQKNEEYKEVLSIPKQVNTMS